MNKKIIFGAATSSYQIEGSIYADDACSSNWHEYASIPGKVKDESNGAITCDSYHHFREDIKLLKDLGFNAYRFSVSWSRIISSANGKVNKKGISFYDKLVDTLLKNNITPYLTIFHWDLPIWLSALGGWSNRDTAYMFRDYAAVLFNTLSDRVRNWITLNEPWSISFLGYWDGQHAPGIKGDFAQVLSTSHHQLLGHGLALEAFHSLTSNEEGMIGISLNPMIAYPLDSNNKADMEAAVRAWDIYSAIYLDPLYKGRYPTTVMDLFERFQPKIIKADDLKTINIKQDFLGINYYSPIIVKKDSSFLGFAHVNSHSMIKKYNCLGWPVYSAGLHDLVTRIIKEFSVSQIFITENGYPLHENSLNGSMIEDDERIEYLKEHIGVIFQMIEDGFPVKGYFVWTLVDNFEWAEGYKTKFGIVSIDFKTQKRTPKKSAIWFKNFLQN